MADNEGSWISDLDRSNCAVVGPLSTDQVMGTDAALQILSSVDLVWMPSGSPRGSDFVFLGLAHAHGLPVFASSQFAGTALPAFVSLAQSPAHACEQVRLSPRAVPAAALALLQGYYRRTAVERGYSSEDARDCILLLTEEVGELARAVRKRVGLSRSTEYPKSEVGHELADVQLYLLHLANILGLDLPDAIVSKERLNDEKFVRSRRSA
jgi:NTP pyrophosphatase (non-canonical NTP hydrolase)